jgi:hypothetical protein
MNSRIALGVLVLALVGWACPAEAQIGVSQSPAIAPDLGKVIAGSAPTTFSITSDGTVTRTSGNAIRLSNGSVTTPTISISCALLNLVNLCAVRYMQVTVQPAGGSGPASVNMFRIGSLQGASFRDGLPTPASAITFVLNPMGLGTTTFKVGMDVNVAAGAASGQQLFSYTVTASFLQ